MTTRWGVLDEAAEQVANQLDVYLARPDAPGLLHKYFDGEGAFSGPWFDFVDRSAHPVNEIGCHDLVAITMLGETIPGLLARDLLCEEAFRTGVSARLSNTPDVDLWEADDDALDAANEAWDFIRAQAHLRRVGMGRTKTSKLLARKRPHLVPITDGVVCAAISLPDGTNYWSAFRAAMRSRPQLVARLLELRRTLPSPEAVSALRVLDALVWMTKSKGSAARLARGDPLP